MRANQTCSEWARLSGYKLRHCEWFELMGFSHRDIFGFTPNPHFILVLITDQIFSF